MTSILPKNIAVAKRSRSWTSEVRIGAVALLLALAVGSMRSQNLATGTDRSDVLQFLDQTINWYRQMDIERSIATGPDDVIIVNDNRPLADQIVHLGFDYARAEAEFAPPGNVKVDENQNSGGSRYQSLVQLASKIDQQIKDAQAELQTDRQKLEFASGKRRRELEATVSELQSEIDLANARRDIIRNMADFVGSSASGNLGTSNLKGQIEALSRTVPVDVAGSTSGGSSSQSTSQTRVSPAISESKAEPSGIWGLTADIFSLSGKFRTINDRMKATDALMDAGKQLRSPLVARLKDLTRQGDAIAQQADTADPAALAQQKKQLDTLTAQFKQLSAATLPLSKQSILLDLYKRNLLNWQSTIKNRYATDIRGLLLRLLILVLVLGCVLGAADLWRKAIYRYVQDQRRRYQFLLIRKIVMWFAIAMVVAFAFASQLGSVATFAGLITAGVAVALQNVILSVAGYFFLIGKFGIRVGDRVQVAGVTGEVVEVGLVRLHLMELSSSGSEIPTGRIVAFSNSIVFQPTAGLFKQIPGTNFAWHEITLTLPGDGDYHSVQRDLAKVVDNVFAEYKDDMDRQRRQMERTLGYTSTSEFRPRTYLRFTSGGLEAEIRYPVTMKNGSEIDDRITRELVDAIAENHRQQAAGQGTPTVKLKTDVPPPNG